MTTRFIWGFTAALTLACSHAQEPPKLTPASGASRSPFAPPSAELALYGTLGALGEGRIGPSVWLSTLAADPSLVALGSLSELRGEVIALDGEIWLGYPTGPSGAYARKLGDSDETAAFLVTASVPEWKTLSLARAIPYAELEAGVEQLGRDAGLDVNAPFPIVIEGTLEKLEFNVVNGRGFEPGKPIPRVVMLASATRMAKESTEGVILGFFGKRAQGKFTHPDSRFHAHVLLREERQVGHVDRVDVPAGATVRLPVPRR
jgi:acetolactate decarboxylase